MAKDTREDAGQYYPGGKVVPTRPITPGGTGSVSWDNVTGKPTAFNPSTHASTHATGGTDAITPAAIGAATPSDITAAVSTKLDKTNGTATDSLTVRGVIVGEGEEMHPTSGVFKVAGYEDGSSSSCGAIRLDSGHLGEPPMLVLDDIILSRMSDADVQIKHGDTLLHSLVAKANKPSSPTSGNFAGLDANGNLTDSGKKAADFLTQHQDISGKANVSDFSLPSGGGAPGAQYVQSLFSGDNTSLASTIQTKIDATVGSINAALDTLNGEVA